MDKRTPNFSQKGFTRNLLGFMNKLEKNESCCLDFLESIVTKDSSSISFSGNGTENNPLTAITLISAASGNTATINSDGLFVAASSTSPIIFSNGLSLNGNNAVLGQSFGQVGNPAQLLSTREIPLNNNSLIISTTHEGNPLLSIFQPNNDDFFLLTCNGNSFIRLRLENLSPGSSAAAGVLMQSDSGNFGWFFQSSSANAFQPDCFSILGTGTGGIQISSVNGPLRFGSTLTQPLGEYARFNTNGQLGLGITSTSATVHIQAGSATAGSAPIKLTSGTVMTTPEAGAFEFDGTNLFFTIGGTRKTVTLT